MTLSSTLLRCREILDVLIAGGTVPGCELARARVDLDEAVSLISHVRASNLDEFIARYDCQRYRRLISETHEPDYELLRHEAQYRAVRDRARHTLLSLAHRAGQVFSLDCYLRVLDVHLELLRLPRLWEVDGLLSRFGRDCRPITPLDWHPTLGRDAFWALTQMRNAIAQGEGPDRAWHELITPHLGFLVVGTR